MSNLLSQRRAGILLHISSLPNGDFGQDARRFVDFLQGIGASIWQTLPLNKPHADGSPYQCLSAHAGNPEFISVEKLQASGLLTQADLAQAGNTRKTLIAKAFANFKQQAKTQAKKDFDSFCQQQAHWLNDFSLFLALRIKFNCSSWNTWPDAYRNRDLITLASVQKNLADEIAAIKFTQYIFFQQWHSLKQYANSKGVYLFGDIPIFVSFDSADVWAQPELFKLDAEKNMTVVAGVPPDYFSATGQRWGNPHYDWLRMEADGFKWWLARMSTQNYLFDMVRIDHFRGLEAAWEIPAEEDSAVNGNWVLAPGDALLNAIKQHLPNITLVAEDLGIITDEVNALREKYDLPGMKILQFAFGGDIDNPYLPENIQLNSVVYTGTHDNDSTLGWYLSLDEQQRNYLHAYLHNDAPDMPFVLVDMALASNAQLAIIPMQDVLQLDSSHRMNTPGTTMGNWSWRFNWDQVTSEISEKIAQSILEHGRGLSGLNSLEHRG